MVPVLLLGFSLNTIIISTYTINLFSLFCHNRYINLPRFFDYLFITPENHRVHHDEDIKNQNSNYGNLFSIWDRMFGTFVRTRENIIFGIKGYYQDNFIKMETDPVIAYIKNLK
jgi:sterol desaturase/sphingolipid hydroxylase (fatty acid hydroxylase superfamily)